MDLHGVQITWLGQGTFLFQTPDNKQLLLDAWVQSNPACPDDKKQLPKLDALLITHGHSDHIGDVIAVTQQAHPDQVVGMIELAGWLQSKGVQNTVGINKGGTISIGTTQVTMVHADHSGGIQDGDQMIYGGEPAGYVLSFQGGLCVYAAGDTDVFGDMRLIADLYHPDVALLPIGDYFTMGPRQAAYATKLLGVQAVIPCHYATFPTLTGTPQAFREALGAAGTGAVEVVEMQPGQTIS